MAGSFPGSNSTSTTGPMIWTILPWLIEQVPFCTRLLGFDCLAKRFRPADDIQELLRDALLTGLVVLDGQQMDHLARVFAGRFHGRHPRPVLAGRRLHERSIDLDRDVARQERGQDGLGTRLVEIFLLGPRVIAAALDLDGQELLADRMLDGDRAELVVHEMHFVHVSGEVVLHEPAGQLLRVRVGQPVEDAQHLALDRELPAAVEVARLLAHDDERHRGLGGSSEKAQGLAKNVRVERAAQPLVRRDDHEAFTPRLAAGEKRLGLVPDLPAEAREQLAHLRGIRPRRENALLGPAELGRGHELHGLGDLLRRLDGADPSLDVPKRRHGGAPYAASMPRAAMNSALASLTAAVSASRSSSVSSFLFAISGMSLGYLRSRCG